MGIVYKAQELSPQRIVALKMILNGRLASAGEVERFRVETEAAARLEHASIVPIYEVGEEEGNHFYLLRPAQRPNACTIPLTSRRRVKKLRS
jgi:serine/threonine-protein kinase